MSTAISPWADAEWVSEDPDDSDAEVTDDASLPAKKVAAKKAASKAIREVDPDDSDAEVTDDAS